MFERIKLLFQKHIKSEVTYYTDSLHYVDLCMLKAHFKHKVDGLIITFYAR